MMMLQLWKRFTTSISTPNTINAARFVPALLQPEFDVECKSFESGKMLGLIGLSKQVFAQRRQDIIYRCLQYERSWREQGTESSKQLGQVRGSSNKPFPQKKRGKARVGTIRAPMFKGGYTVHGPRPHLKTIDIQRKVYELGIRSALGVKIHQNDLHVVDDLKLEQASKSLLKERLQNLGLVGKKVSSTNYKTTIELS
jgi:large subunit ribosomal protein L4